MITYDEQAAEFLRKTQTALKITWIGAGCPLWDDERHIHGTKYSITLTRGKRSYRFDYWNSYTDKKKRIKPCAYDILACLRVEEYKSLEEFCPEFGYDIDSRKAEKTFHAVNTQAQGLKTLFNDREIKELAEIN